MTHLDLCTGIGGFHLAAQWAGFETLGFSEIDPYCCALLNQKWPVIKNYGDLRTADFSPLRNSIDVLSAGVPCQPASLAGKRRGKEDHRWLWPPVLDVVESVHPSWCLFENPDGILSLDEFGGVLLRLASLGYEVRLFRVPANALGAKHRRFRTFIVANRSCQLPHWSGNSRQSRWPQSPDSRQTLPYPDLQRSQIPLPRSQPSQLPPSLRVHRPCLPPPFRLSQPPICRRTHGIRNRVHRLKALGNSVVPHQAFPFFLAIYQTSQSLPLTP